MATTPFQKEQIYDIVIIGGGPGGYTAALYGARAGLSTLVLERLSAGGQMALTHRIDNYPGFPKGIDGYTLGESMQQQAESFGAETKWSQVTRVELQSNPKVIHTDSEMLLAKTVILATGANPKKLGLEKEAVYAGQGVHYCAACDGMFYKGKTVAVVGGGDSAVADALLLSHVAEKVFLIHRRDTLRAAKLYHEALQKAGNMEFIWNSQVVDLVAEDKLTGVVVENRHSGERSTVPCQGVFISVGRQPATELFTKELNLDSNGYIISGETTDTNIPGVFAVGDVRTKPLRQVVTAVADGAVAVYRAEGFLAASEI